MKSGTVKNAQSRKRAALAALTAALLALCAACAGMPADSPEGADAGTAEASPTAALDLAKLLQQITAADIVYVDYDSITAEALAPALNDAAQHVTVREGLTGDYVWLAAAFLDGTAEGGYSCEDAVSLSSGLEADIVQVDYQSQRLYCESAALYALVTGIYDFTGTIDGAGLKKYASAVQDRVDETVAAFAASAPDAGFSGADILGFEKQAEYDDIIDGTVCVYRLTYALVLSSPENVIFAGGMVLDSRHRLLGCDSETLFAATEQGGETVCTAFLSYDIYHGASAEAREQNGRLAVAQAVLEALGEK